MRRLYIHFAILSIGLFTIEGATGQRYEPMELAKRIFSKQPISEIGNYVTGEYQGKPNGEDLQDGAITKFLLLSQKENTAVVAMTILDSSGKGLDTYLHFKKDSTWKMTAFRALAMTGMIERMQIELESMTIQQVDDLIDKSKNKKDDDLAIFKSRDDYYFQLGNSRLILELDEKIIRHFNDNRTEFERLKELAIRQMDKEKNIEERRNELIREAKKDYQKLLISSVSDGGEGLYNCINFLIGGILDNQVGYIYVKD